MVPQHLVLARRARSAPRIDGDGRRCGSPTTRSPGYRLDAAPGPDGRAPEALFCDNETNAPRVFGAPATTPYPKDGINDHVVSGAATVNPDGFGTKAALRYRVTVPAGGTAELRLRLHRPAPTAPVEPDWAAGAFDAVVAAREADADEFYAHLAPQGTTPEQLRVLRQAGAGLVWSKQCYPYTSRAGSTATRASRSRRAAPRHPQRGLAAPGLVRRPGHARPVGVPVVRRLGPRASTPSPGRTSTPPSRSTRCWCCCASGSSTPTAPCPPTSGTSTTSTRRCTCWPPCGSSGSTARRDREFLERVFQKLLVNFTWWLNREDADGNNVFGGGFLGLDNISPIDRSKLPDGYRLEQADGTAWMAYYAMSMLVIAVELAEQNPVYDDMVVKFLEQFLQIRRALEEQGLYDAEDAFFYDRLVHPSGSRRRCGCAPSPAWSRCCPPSGCRGPGGPRRPAREGVRHVREGWARARRHPGRPGARARRAGEHPRLGAAPRRRRLALQEFLDEDAFLSPHGLRSVSKRYEGQPYSLPGMPGATIDYEPAESTTAMFGGNSNWRGPVWMPLNYLAVRQFAVWQRFLGDDYTLEYPTGSGEQHTFGEVAQDLADRLVSIWLPDAHGRRPVFGGVRRLQEDPAWKDNLLFFEYFHGDDGAGLGRDAPDRLDARWSSTCCSTRRAHPATGTPGRRPPRQSTAT